MNAKREGKAAKASLKTFTIHAHVREKIITINAGAGNQCIYWLGASAVNRFLSQPFSYTSNFSQELTAKAVISEEGEHLERSARICTELSDGEHVWIDVGDGKPLSHVRSRTFPDRRILEPDADSNYQEQVGWEASAPDMLDDEVIGIDPRQSMRYVRTVLTKQPEFHTWKQDQPSAGTSQEGQFELFNAAWQKVSIEDMGPHAGGSQWLNGVKGAFWHNFEALKYIFTRH